MKVMKFGGTSLENAGMIKKAAALVEGERDCFVVCSAVAGVTDMLEEISLAWEREEKGNAEKIFGKISSHFHNICCDLYETPLFLGASEKIIQSNSVVVKSLLNEKFTPYGRDLLLAQGETVTSKIISLYLKSRGTTVKLINAFDIIWMDCNREPSINDIRTRLNSITKEPSSGRFLTQGYICSDYNGNPSNLGRGGSDYTATLAGAALGAEMIEIWTDIDGIRNNDPRVVNETYPVRRLSFREASELAYFGAKILHPECVWPAGKYNIPIQIKKTVRPEVPGTLVCREPERKGVKAVCAKDGITAIRIESGRMLNTYGFLSKIFTIFENSRTPIDVVTTSEVSVSVTIDNTGSLQRIVSELKSLGEVHVENNLAIVCVVGDILEKHKGHAVRILHSLKPFSVKMISYGGSRNNITIVVPEKEKEKILCSLNKFLFLNSLNVKKDG